MKKLIILISILFVGLSSAFAAEKTTTSDFGVNAFYVDCRAQVITIDALHELALDLSTKGINTLLMEWEGTFPFEKHATLSNELAYSKKEIEGFVAYCTELGIDVIPLQNCFGHSEYILRHNRYYALREDKKEVSMICPLKHKLAEPIFREIFAEVAALHPSKYFHIGADETFLLGSCAKCQEVVKEHGKSRLFVDYVNAMSEIVMEMGKTPVIWADIILKYPESVAELSKDIVFVDWNYGWDVNRFGDLQHLFDAGVKLWGASALRSGPDNMYITQWMKHFNNLATFIPHARENGYQGIVNTSWSTSGVYGYHYDSSWEILSMQPIRLVYPTQAFNILLEAYAESMESVEPLDAEAFILKYAKDYFGASDEDALKLLNYMKLPQEVMGRNGKDKKGVAVADVIIGSEKVLAEFATFSPKQNKWEYDHLYLMLEMRINYLKYKEIEALYDSKKYNGEQAAEFADRMEDIVKESDKLHVSFVKLNKDYLKDGQWQLMKNARSEKMEALHLRLKNYIRE